VTPVTPTKPLGALALIPPESFKRTRTEEGKFAVTTVLPPRDLLDGGRRLWLEVTGDYTLDPPELELLAETCRTVDLLARLRGEVEEAGLMVTRSSGAAVHPGVAELRQQRLVLARLVAALGLPKGLADDAVEGGSGGGS